VSFVWPQHHQADLRTKLEEQGWDVEVMETDASQWWLVSLWRLRSRWRPAGLLLYLGFVGDPGELDPGRVGEIVLGRDLPEDRMGSGARFALSPNWGAERTRLLATAAAFRNEQA
jgi:hypothetical protein